MSKYKIIGPALPNIPWEDKPAKVNGPVWRYTNNPVVDRNPQEGIGRVFNSAIVPYGEKFIAVIRAEYVNGRPMLHLAYSDDAIHWDIEKEAIKFVDEDGHPYMPKYAYDPRLVKVQETYYIIWCTDFNGAALGFAKTDDFKRFTRLENPFLPFNRNGVLFPKKFKDNFLMLSRPSDSGHTPFGDIFLSESPDLTYWGRHRHVMSKGGSGWWQSLKIGGGPAPIETDIGWLMFYHGVTGTCNGYVYSMGTVILDKDNPSKVLYRCKNYVLTPEVWYEEKGFVDNVIFPCATLQDSESGKIAIYYGAADTYVAMAFTDIDTIIDYTIANDEANEEEKSLGKI